MAQTKKKKPAAKKPLAKAPIKKKLAKSTVKKEDALLSGFVVVRRNSSDGKIGSDANVCQEDLSFKDCGPTAKIFVTKDEAAGWLAESLAGENGLTVSPEFLYEVVPVKAIFGINYFLGEKDQLCKERSRAVSCVSINHLIKIVEKDYQIQLKEIERDSAENIRAEERAEKEWRNLQKDFHQVTKKLDREYTKTENQMFKFKEKAAKWK